MWTQIRLLLQAQSDLVPHCFSKKVEKHFSRRLCCIGPLTIKKCDFQFVYCQDFHTMYARLYCSNNLLTMVVLILTTDQ